MKPNIRYDLFAVKELDTTQCPDWCVVRITTDRKAAFQAAKDIDNNHSLGIRRQGKVVHPHKDTVTAFLAVGNSIT